jgi:molybdate transport system substrate-binding protein
MTTLRVLSGGAAQAVVEKIAEEFRRETGHDIRGEFSAVGAMRDKVVAGEAVDVVILTAALIDELAAAGHVVAGSRRDLGKVGTGVAVRAGTPLPDVSSPEALRGNLLAASKIACPDPAVATAGKVVMRMLELLGISEAIKGKMQFFPNGYAAMKWLAASGGSLEMGITQVTEILPNPGVALAGQLPDALQMKAVYSAGLGTRAANAEVARAFIARLVAPAARPVLTACGYELAG